MAQVPVAAADALVGASASPRGAVVPL